MDAYLNKAVGVDFAKIEEVPHEELEGVRERLKEARELFYEYYFTVENRSVGVRKYTPEERKSIKSSRSTMSNDTPFALLENGWILGKTHIHFYFNSYQDFKLTYLEMANVSWHETSSFFSTQCSFCNPAGLYVALDCGRMEVVKNLFATYPSSREEWDNKINQIVGRWAVLTDTYNGKFPSDHFPVMVELEF